MPYFFSSYPHSAGVPPAPLLWELSNYCQWELSNYCQCTGKWKEFPQTVPATTTAANKIGWIHEVAVFNSSLLLPTAACGMMAQPQGRSRLYVSLIIKLKIPAAQHTCDCCHFD